MRDKGIITSWNTERGFGFITPDKLDNKHGRQVFIHIKSIKNLHQSQNRQSLTGKRVSYSLSTDSHGRTCAANSLLSKGVFYKSGRLFSRLIPVISVIACFTVIGLAVYMNRIPPFIMAFYVLFTLLTFFIYAADKSAAKKGHWRIKETSLHLLSLAGGWPGALLAQRIFRHKTRKKMFQGIFWLTAIINAGIFVWLLTPVGAEYLQTLINGVIWGLTAEFN